MVKTITSPAPFGYTDNGSNGLPKVYDKNGDGIAEEHGDDNTQREANARFIVTACNAHDELLEACKEALDALNQIPCKRLHEGTSYDVAEMLGRVINGASQ